MTTAKTAHERLITIARQGSSYRWDQVFTPGGIPEPDPTRIVGKGFDFTRTIQVLDSVDGTVDGTVELRMLEEDEALFLRTRLSWQSSTGGEHESFASYKLTSGAAERLDNTPVGEKPTQDEIEDMGVLSEALFTAIEEAGRYEASWKQTYPGAGFDLYDDDDQRAATQAKHDYHAQAVLAAKEAEPDLLCMLSDTDLGAVHPNEISAILDWVEHQPEVSQS
jgi:hypothetical protein